MIATAAAALVLAPVTPAAAETVGADERAEGLWHVDMLGLDAVQAEGATGEGVTIAVIDTFINPDVPELQGADVQVRGSTCADPETGAPRQIVSDDPALAAHGTNVVSMLVGTGQAGDGGPGARGVAPDAEVWFYGVGSLDAADPEHCALQDPTVEADGIDLTRDISWFAGEVEENIQGLGDLTSLAARAAIRDGADVISMSVLSGSSANWEQVAFESMIAEVPIVFGVLNPLRELMLPAGPIGTNGLFPVNAIERDGRLLTDRETGKSSGMLSNNIAVAAPGDQLLGVGAADGWGPTLIAGTSYATPITAAAVALALEQHPEATPFQVMQAVLRTTGTGGVHDIEWAQDRLGAGYLNVPELLAAEPRDFPDENPQWVTSLEDPRCVDAEGTEGHIDESNGLPRCHWTTGPFPEGLEKYRAVYVDGEPITTLDEPIETPYSKPPTDAGAEAQTGREPSTASSPLWTPVAVGAVSLVGLAAAGVIVWRSAARRARSRGRSEERGEAS
ncbi:S8/S53 family peptidase [Leucobacter chromiiresistens]|uniref:Subtilase family protein n=1 Tax=Leucobacter chromiiresistens TaxID=1079994 RepID=A0A1H0YAA6_9MICO|nr:S8/S53 family peptidase [Leucobacter chromiiresistens]SDQ11993.1 Subtilase family protein [Leucobacter chromiiresistens]